MQRTKFCAFRCHCKITACNKLASSSGRYAVNFSNHRFGAKNNFLRMDEHDWEFSEVSRPLSALWRSAVSSFKSWPAQNTGPTAARMITRTSGLSIARSSASLSAFIIASDRAFKRNGSFKVRQNTPAHFRKLKVQIRLLSFHIFGREMFFGRPWIFHWEVSIAFNRALLSS